MKRKTLLELALLTGFAIGLAAFGSFLAGLAYSNQERFCVSCHEMEKPYAEYQETVHYRNRSGIRALCSDCHVPKDVPPMLVRKVKASVELWAHLTNKIPDGEAYERYRYGMAKAVWREMQHNDSRECRSCHRLDAWDEGAMSERAQSRHEKGKREGLTCIDCHYGIAHREPEGPGPQELRELSANTQ